MSKKNNEKSLVDLQFKADNPSHLQNSNSLNKEMYGINDEGLLIEVIRQTACAMSGNKSKSMQIVAQSTTEMKPKDPIEAKLCAKEAALYTLSLTYLERAEANRFAENPLQHLWFETDMNYALKFLRIHNETVEALNRYRRQGEQRVIVQHVNVNEGGQAIVGHVETGGGGKQ